MLFFSTMSKNLIIAIDGPSGSGKSTIAKYLADQINATYIDTGAMYRAITFAAMEKGIEDDTDKVIELARNAKIEIKYENGTTRVFIDGKEVTDNIRSAAVNNKVSDISTIPEVREVLVRIQRELGNRETVVAEGRDTSTIVFPDADIKIYLTASLDTRAERRLKEYLDKGVEITLSEVKANLANRDRIDSGRKVSPLTKADDAFEIDSTSMTINEELKFLLDKIRHRLDED
jgi:cytidylate kinase